MEVCECCKSGEYRLFEPVPVGWGSPKFKIDGNEEIHDRLEKALKNLDKVTQVNTIRGFKLDPKVDSVLAEQARFPTKMIEWTTKYLTTPYAKAGNAKPADVFKSVSSDLVAIYNREASLRYTNADSAYIRKFYNKSYDKFIEYRERAVKAILGNKATEKTLDNLIKKNTGWTEVKNILYPLDYKKALLFDPSKHKKFDL